MKLNSIPDPVWYALLGLAAFGGVWWLGKRAAGAVGDAVGDAARAAGQTAYNAGNKVQDAIIPGEATLGTWVYDRVQDARAAIGLPSDHDITKPTTKPRPRSVPPPGAGDVPAAYVPGGSWASPAPYDYGTAGTRGIPYRPEAKPLPDIFNFSLDYLK